MIQEKLKPLFIKREKEKDLFNIKYNVPTQLFKPYGYESEKFKLLEYEKIKKDTYIISNYGNVYNKNTGTKLKQTTSKGYKQLTLLKEKELQTSNSKLKMVRVHRAVATTFIPKTDPDKDIVNHLNGIPSDNYVGNLEWTDISGNTQHGYDNGLNNNKGENATLGGSYKEVEIIKICELLSQGLTPREIMKEFGYNSKKEHPNLYRQIYKIKERKAWRHIVKNYNF